jgi:hypothetical protein
VDSRTEESDRRGLDENLSLKYSSSDRFRIVSYSLEEEPMRPNFVGFVSAVLLPVFLTAAAQIALAQAAPSAPIRAYVWFAEVVSYDTPAKTMTAKAAVTEAVAKYIDRFKPGQHVMLVWTADHTKPETGPVRYIEIYEAMKGSNIDQGYILPVELVSADAAARTITFKATVPASAARTLTGIQPGRSIAVTTPMRQPSETAAIESIETSDRSQPAPPKSSETHQEGPTQPPAR